MVLRQNAVNLSLFILLCGMIQSPVFLDHLRSFLFSPFVWLWNGSAAYKLWSEVPYYHSVFNHMETRPFPPFWSLPVKILSVMVIIILLCIALSLLYLLHLMCRYYKYRWCTLSRNVALCSLALLTGLGPWLAKYLHVNIVLLFFVIQIIYLLVLYCDAERKTFLPDWLWEGPEVYL